MYPKIFFENFWEREQKNELFVCMPFHVNLDGKFDVICEVAKELGFDRAVRVKEDYVANDITYKILGGIGNSRTLLFDLSDDPKSHCEFSKQANINVLYELGISTAIREPEDILLIREKSKSELPFDIKSLNINGYEGPLNRDWLNQKLKAVLDGQNWYKSRRVIATAKSIDSIGLKLILKIYKENREGEDHFNDEGLPTEVKLAILRLIDLGILWFATDKKGTEYAYHWTPFGRAVIKYLGVEKSIKIN